MHLILSDVDLCGTMIKQIQLTESFSLIKELNDIFNIFILSSVLLCM
jgi:hypothetical protein